MTYIDPDDAARPDAEAVDDSERDDWADLQTSLVNLAGLVAASLDMEQMLERVASFAAHAIPGADGASVALLQLDGTRHRVDAIASSAPFVAEIDEIQLAVLDEGPCLTAALERRTVRADSLGGQRVWPRFGPRVGRLGVHSTLSLPLAISDELVGAINVYARGKGVFDEHAQRLGELFAAPAAVAVHNAYVLARARALTAQLERALSSRPVIDQAIGMLRARTGASTEDALARLREISQREHTKLVDVAQGVVNEAVRRAQARQSR